MMNDRDECTRLRQVMPEVALGIASIEDQALVLGHARGCPDCRAELSALSGLADDVMALVPPAEPPSGFESSVITAVAPPVPTARSGPGRLVRALRLAAVIVLVAALSGGVVWWSGAEDRRVAGQLRQTLETAQGEYIVAFPVRDAAGARQGSVFAYQGDPVWLYVALDSTLPPGEYDFELVTTAGVTQPVRADVDMTDRRGWGTTMEIPVHDVAQLRVLDESGQLVLIAHFTRS